MANSKKPKLIDSPELLLEWDYDKNSKLGLFPEKLGKFSNKKAWWICSKGHSWDMTITQRSSGQGCPYCSGRRVLAGYNDLATTHPHIAAQWHPTKNTDLSISPSSVSKGNHTVVWWICEKGHEYQLSINKKVYRTPQCPICFGTKVVSGVNDFATLHPELAKEWHPTRNKSISPTSISEKSGKKVWWVCPFGHEYEATLHSRISDNTGCPICNLRNSSSFPEQAVFFYVKQLYPNTINKYLLPKSTMELDIYIPDLSIGIEYDGKAWHNSNTVHEREIKKLLLCRDNGIHLIRLKEECSSIWTDTCDKLFLVKLQKRSNAHLEIVIKQLLEYLCPTNDIAVDLQKDEVSIRSYLSALMHSLVEERPDLAAEWDYDKNAPLLPSMFGANSNAHAWWICSACGHHWRTTISARGGKRNSGCPICSKSLQGKKFTANVVQNVGSLAETMPELAAQWHPTKNGSLTPNDITAGRFKSVWWLCPVCGHEWSQSPNNRKKGIGCPCCAGRVPKTGVNDLATVLPDIAAEWDYVKNDDLRPEQFLPKSGKSVWWKCSKCGYEWEAIIRSRTNGIGCPACGRKRQKKNINQYTLIDWKD